VDQRVPVCLVATNPTFIKLTGIHTLLYEHHKETCSTPVYVKTSRVGFVQCVTQAPFLVASEELIKPLHDGHTKRGLDQVVKNKCIKYSYLVIYILTFARKDWTYIQFTSWVQFLNV
jgi:hypothetical protein